MNSYITTALRQAIWRIAESKILRARCLAGGGSKRARRDTLKRRSTVRGRGKQNRKRY